MYAGRIGHAGFRDGPRQRALFNAPRGMCADTNGTLIVADSNNACIRRIAADGELMSHSFLLAPHLRRESHFDELCSQASKSSTEERMPGLPTQSVACRLILPSCRIDTH